MKKLIRLLTATTISLLMPLAFVLAQGVTTADTNGDGTNDFTLRTHDTDGDGKIDKVHFDTDNDGIEDANETVIQCREMSVIMGGGGGAGRTIILRCNTGTETTVDRWTVRDNNGDGDTSDAGELQNVQP